MSRPFVSTRRLAVVVALLLFGASSAMAHTGLKRSEPAARSRLAVPPSRIALWFTERPQLAFSRIRLFGPAGEIPLEALRSDAANGLHAGISGTLTPGVYRVEWRAAASDGHPSEGQFTFEVFDARAAAPPASATPKPPTAAQLAPPPARVRHSEFRTARWIEFVALLTVLGVLGFRHGVLPPLAARGVPTADAADRARRLGMSVLVLYVAAALVRLYTESVAIHGAENALVVSEVVSMLTATVWGAGWLLGAIGAAIAALGWAASRRSVTIGTPLALTGAVGMAFSPALSGHAGASSHFILSVAFDVLHIVAAGVWVGGLLIVLIAGIPAMRRLSEGNSDAAVSALVNSFHPLALFCAPLVVLAGGGTSWIRLGDLSSVWSTEYGRILLLKIALVALVAGMGMYNSMRARRRLGAAEGTRHIRTTAAIEVMLAACVLWVTTLLVTLPVPSEMPTP